MKLYTYDEIASLLGTTKEILYGVVSHYDTPLKPTKTVNKKRLFSEQTVSLFKEWWLDNSDLRSSPASEVPDGDALDLSGALEYLGMTLATLRYYRRRYRKPYPDYRVSGRYGRPRGMFLKKSLDEFKQWVADGKPEHGPQVEHVLQDYSPFSFYVVFRDGTAAGLVRSTWRVVPQTNDDAKYIDVAQREIARIAKRAPRPKKIKQA